MKKYLFSILFLLAFCRLSYAGAISVSSFNTADDVTVSHLETMRSTFQGAINSADGGLLQTATVTSAKLDANTNPENRWNEAFNDFVYSGLIPPTTTNTLTSITTSGTAYIQGVRVVKDATSHPYTASKHTYVDLSTTGTYTYSEVAINATAPEVAANSIRLAKVSTDTSKVLSVTDMRTTTITLGVGSATFLADADANTMVQVEETANEDKIRFDTGGTERAFIDDSGLTSVTKFLASNGSVSVPSYSFSNDTDTGIYWATTDKLLFASAGVLQFALSTGGVYVENTIYPGYLTGQGGGVISQGNATTYWWDTIYADDFINIADWFYFDDKDDLTDIGRIKPSGLLDEHGRKLIDDNTLPEYILAKDKDGKIIKTDIGNKPSISLKAAISLCFGAIRQLDKENKELKQKIDDLEVRIEKLEK